MKIFDKTARCLIETIGCALRGEDAAPSGADWREVKKLADRHGITELLYCGIEKNSALVPTDIREKLRDEHLRNVRREAVQQVETERILAALTESGFDCLPLKGHIIKNLYAKPYMRHMADVDILLRPSEAESAESVMSRLGYTLGSRSSHHDLYKKPPVMVVELHKVLLEGGLLDSINDYFGDGWAKAVPVGDGRIYGYGIEDLYIYMAAHTASHFLKSGTGIKSVCDVFLFFRKYGGEIDEEYLNAEFEKMGMTRFSNSIRALADAWFGGGEETPETAAMGEYIISCGTYGETSNLYVTKYLRGEHGERSASSKAGRMFDLAFPARASLESRYPWSKKSPLLLPAAWAARSVSVIRNFGQAKRRVKYAADVSDKDISSLARLFDGVGGTDIITVSRRMRDSRVKNRKNRETQS